MPIGERMITTGYIKHPAVASGWLPDGAPLDAGTAHIVHTNLSHLSEQNTRLIGHALGPGQIGYNDGIGAWPSIADEYLGDDEYSYIPWTRMKSAVNFGPLALAFTRIGTSPPGLYPRSIQVVVECEKSSVAATSLKILAALTAGPDTPRRSQRLVSDYVTYTDASPGQKVATITLSVSAPLRPTTAWRCRASGSTEASSTFVTPVWVWIGWNSIDNTNADYIWSVSAFEVY